MSGVGSSSVAWTIILGWLHHVSWLGLGLLGPVVGGLIATSLGYAAMFRIAPVSVLVALIILFLSHPCLKHLTVALILAEDDEQQHVSHGRHR